MTVMSDTQPVQTVETLKETNWVFKGIEILERSEGVRMTVRSNGGGRLLFTTKEYDDLKELFRFIIEVEDSNEH